MKKGEKRSTWLETFSALILIIWFFLFSVSASTIYHSDSDVSGLGLTLPFVALILSSIAYRQNKTKYVRTMMMVSAVISLYILLMCIYLAIYMAPGMNQF